MSVSPMLLLFILGSVAVVVVWGIFLIKRKCVKELVLGMLCLLLTNTTVGCFTYMIAQVWPHYERGYARGVIERLGKMIPEKSNELQEAMDLYLSKTDDQSILILWSKLKEIEKQTNKTSLLLLDKGSTEK